MVSKTSLATAGATVLVAVAIFAHVANYEVPENLSSYDDKLIRRITLGVEMNRLMRKLPINLHVHVTNFAWSVFTVLIEANLNLSHESTYVQFTDMELNSNVSIRLYEPVKEINTPRPGLIFIHGGGMQYGNPEIYHVLTQHLANELDVILMSVDYQHSWEGPFPAALEDSTQATVWFMKQAHKLNIDPRRIAISGDSAGAQVAAAITQRLTFNKNFANLPTLKFHALFYPGLQAFDFKTPSFQQHGNKPSAIATTEFITFCYSYYLVGHTGLRDSFKDNMHTSAEAKQEFGKILSHNLVPAKFKQKGYSPPKNNTYGNKAIYEGIRTDLVHPDAAPLLRANLEGLPPSYVVTVEQDPLRDDGIIYVQRLRAAGVPATWKHYINGIHGMFQLSIDPFSIEAGKQSVQDFIDFAQEQFYGK